ncbi:MAG: hypothetical protein OXJ54_14690 [Gemmatimonadetes bacterium]|nr:hypothetical protein [Candidatus Palauibacter rhopaloidicola]
MIDPIKLAGAEFFPDRVVVPLDVDEARRAAVEEAKMLNGNWKTDPAAMEHPVSSFVALEFKRLAHGDDHPMVVEGRRGDPSSRISDAVLLTIAEAAVAQVRSEGR